MINVDGRNFDYREVLLVEGNQHQPCRSYPRMEGPSVKSVLPRFLSFKHSAAAQMPRGEALKPAAPWPDHET